MGVPGSRAMGLIADGRLVWIMRELSERALLVTELEQRLEIPHSTLEEKIDLLVRASVVRREARGGRSSGVVQHLEDVGLPLLALVDRVIAWELRVNPGAPPLMFGAAPGSPTLAILGDEATPGLLLELSDSPRSFTGLVRALHPLSRSQIERRLKNLVRAGLARRGADRYQLDEAGRQASAFLAPAAHLERRHLLPGASAVAPADVAALLSLTAPLVRPLPDTGSICELIVEPDHGVGDAVTCRLMVGENGQLRTLLESAAAPPPAATVRGPVADWCDALVGGRPSALRFGGDSRMAKSLTAGLYHHRLLNE